MLIQRQLCGLGAAGVLVCNVLWDLTSGNLSDLNTLCPTRWQSFGSRDKGLLAAPSIPQCTPSSGPLDSPSLFQEDSAPSSSSQLIITSKRTSNTSI